MSEDKGIKFVSLVAPPEELDEFCSHLDAAWIDEALEATGTATIRRRRLPSAQVVWLIIGMALFRKRSITEVVSDWDLALTKEGERPRASRSAISQARSRVGSEALKYLFEKSADVWSCTSADKHL